MFDHLETLLTIHEPKDVLSAGSLCGPLWSLGPLLPPNYHVSVSNMLSELLKCVTNKKKLTEFLGAKPGTDCPAAKCWVEDFVSFHKYHAPSFYQIFCHTLVN